eukprot:COSAG01_NODE_59945_length_297_cov_0.959596_1_plen_49_part_01
MIGAVVSHAAAAVAVAAHTRRGIGPRGQLRAPQLLHCQRSCTAKTAGVL